MYLEWDVHLLFWYNGVLCQIFISTFLPSIQLCLYIVGEFMLCSLSKFSFSLSYKIGLYCLSYLPLGSFRSLVLKTVSAL